MSFGRVKRPNAIRALNDLLIDDFLGHMKRCMEEIGLTPNEFNFVLPLFTTEMILRRIRESKARYRGRLFVLLSFLKKIAI